MIKQPRPAGRAASALSLLVILCAYSLACASCIWLADAYLAYSGEFQEINRHWRLTHAVLDTSAPSSRRHRQASSGDGAPVCSRVGQAGGRPAPTPSCPPAPRRHRGTIRPRPGGHIGGQFSDTSRTQNARRLASVSFVSINLLKLLHYLARPKRFELLTPNS